jgi:hypothetical protein
MRFASPRVEQRHIALNTFVASRIWNGTLCLWSDEPSWHLDDMLKSVMLRFVACGPRHVCALRRLKYAGWLVDNPGMQGRLRIIGPRHVCALRRLKYAGWLVNSPGTQGRLRIIGSHRLLHGFSAFTYRGWLRARRICCNRFRLLEPFRG